MVTSGEEMVTNEGHHQFARLLCMYATLSQEVACPSILWESGLVFPLALVSTMCQAGAEVVLGLVFKRLRRVCFHSVKSDTM